MILLIIMTALLILCVGSPQAQSGYFPLAVGNQWFYECTYVVYEPTYEHDEPVCKVFVDSTGYRHGTAELQELAITDTVRISTDLPQKGAWITGSWPDPPDGKLYYLLEGRIVDKIGLRPSSNISSGQWYDALLLREARIWEEVYGEEEGVFNWTSQNEPIEGLIVVGGVRNGVDGQWLLFDKDIPLWHLPPGGRNGVIFWNMGVEVGEEVQIWYNFSNGGYDRDPVQVPAGTYTSVGCSTIESGGLYSKDGTYIEQISRYGTSLCFAEGTGIVRIGEEEQGLDLVDFVPGSTHPTTVELVNWGRIKKEIWEK